jgi:hypothetical protein
MQSDTIIYGRNLDDFFRREFGGAADPVPAAGEVRHIAFWSDLVERNPLAGGNSWRLGPAFDPEASRPF